VEREIDELDRGVHLAALFFVLLGAGIGLSMAERIADPVSRLTRATRRIARGDFDEHIAIRSADELRRLVDAFNSMAAELKAQRAQLERTHRLEAWAEMARQVAHEIKNPLTPIQLSAEHLRRVHADRGEPMGEVLESCVSSILGQVHLLRQISAEFSSFASAPTAKRAEVDVRRLIAEVVDPYRTGLADRVDIVVGPAAEAIDDMPAEPTFDFVFLDADKTGYPEYYEQLVPRLTQGGLLLIDNVLLGGSVTDPQEERERLMDELNDHVTADERVDSVMIFVADGLTLVRKR
jgi:HAMP domain-containing protein